MVLSKLKVVFVGGNSVIDQVINDVTHGTVSHVAVEILGGTLEAKGMKEESDKYPGVWLHEPGKYDSNPLARIMFVDVPDVPGAEAEARKLIGTLYGYTDCVRGGMRDLTGVELPGNTLTANCSETVTRVLRAGGLDVLPGVPADCVTPEALLEVLDAGQQQSG